MPRRRSLLVLRGSLCALAALACQAEPPAIREPARLGGRVVAAEILEEGRRGYLRHCRTCHGVAGDGEGPTGWSQRPRPRDLRDGVLKFGSVPAGALPTDDDLRRIVRDGLAGTAMVPWDVPPARLEAIVQYVKLLSPRWREEEPGEPVVANPDPWIGRERDAVLRGELVYHGVARCQACHPAYLSAEAQAGAARALGVPPQEPRPDPHVSTLSRSDFGGMLRATDFLADDLRSVRAGSREADLYRVIAAGVGGTAMPTWKGALPEPDLWAMARYVAWLAASRGRATPSEVAGRGGAAAWPRMAGGTP